MNSRINDKSDKAHDRAMKVLQSFLIVAMVVVAVLLIGGYNRLF